MKKGLFVLATLVLLPACVFAQWDSGITGLTPGSVESTYIAADAIYTDHLADEDWGPIIISGGAAVIDTGVVDSVNIAMDAINSTHLADEDWGPIVISGGAAVLDTGAIDSVHTADASIVPKHIAPSVDWGDFTFSAGDPPAAAIDASALAGSELASTADITIDSINAGPIVSTGNIEAATYGSDGTVSDAELLYINSLSSNAQTQLTGLAIGTSDGGAAISAATNYLDFSGSQFVVADGNTADSCEISIAASAITSTELAGSIEMDTMKYMGDATHYWFVESDATTKDLEFVYKPTTMTIAFDTLGRIASDGDYQVWVPEPENLEGDSMAITNNEGRTITITSIHLESNVDDYDIHFYETTGTGGAAGGKIQAVQASDNGTDLYYTATDSTTMLHGTIEAGNKIWAVPSADAADWCSFIINWE